MRLTPQNIIKAQGKKGSGQVPPNNLYITNDSRKVKENSLFVAMNGKKTNGKKFIKQAIQKGASAIISNEKLNLGKKIWVLNHKDPQTAYGKLANTARKEWGGNVIGITGSIGKSTIKDLTAAALGTNEDVAASPYSFNNEIGLPYSILNAKGTEKYMVLEMGAKNPGDINYLKKIAEPNCAIYSFICNSHAEYLGGIQGVIKEKGSLVSGWKGDKSLVISSKNNHHREISKLSSGAKIIKWGPGEKIDSEEIKLDKYGIPSFKIKYKNKTYKVNLSLPGSFQVGNSLAALSAAINFNVDLNNAITRIEKVKPLPHRKEIHEIRNNGILLDDCYNAGAKSTKESIRWASSISVKRPKVMILGDILETGNNEIKMHKEIGKIIKDNQYSQLLTVGNLAKHALKESGIDGSHYQKTDDLLNDLKKYDFSAKVILVKGSRSIRLEKITKKIREIFST